MKTIFQKFGLFAAMLLIVKSAFAYDFEADKLYFSLISLPERTCKLTTGDNTYQGELQIPEKVTYAGLELTVTELDPNAFNSKITGLTIPASITVIPEASVSKCSLTKLIINDSKTGLTIKDRVKKSDYIYPSTYGQPLKYVYLGRNLNGDSFNHQVSLERIDFGQYVTKMPNLSSCDALVSIYIPDNITELATEGLATNKKLKEVFIGNGVTKIPNYFFTQSKALECVYLGNSISQIGHNTFTGCEKLTYIYLFSDRLSKISDNTSEYIASTIPSTVAKIYVPDPSRYETLLGNYYREPLITINQSSSEYNGTVPTLSYASSVPASEISIIPTSLNVNVGTYTSPVNVCFSFENGWKSSANISATYSITPASLTVIANNATKKYGTENPELTCSVFGLKNNETPEVFTAQPKAETTASIQSPVGEYPIIASGGEAKNYSFNYERGTLTITKADQIIEWAQNFDKVKVGDVIELTATASSGLSIKYTSTNERIADIYTQQGKKYVEFLNAGEVSIRADQDGDSNFNEADRASKSASVRKAVTSVVITAEKATIKIGDKLQLYATILPDDATDSSIVWDSSDPTIATISDNGLLEAIQEGEVFIRATSSSDPEIFATCKVTISKNESIEESTIKDSTPIYDLYNLQGVLIARSINDSMITNIVPPGTYILVSPHFTKKIKL